MKYLVFVLSFGVQIFGLERHRLYLRVTFTFCPGYARSHFRPWPLTHWVSLCVFLFQCLGLFLTPRRSTAKTSGSVLLGAWSAEEAKAASGKEHEESTSRALGQHSLFNAGLQINYKFTLISNVPEKLII